MVWRQEVSVGKAVRVLLRQSRGILMVAWAVVCWRKHYIVEAETIRPTYRLDELRWLWVREKNR